ncbi:MBL fold metallo-hydrolase [Corallococcus praedator]|uniref:MBL fold metallo-hydrolase n=1 Tax=Corallococcus praedator TaxID=2316724 RepID=A0ABX9QK69_9BACT|nr:MULTISPECIES: MBL fold metallo-hydrolase [Corallococcus]RKH36045.1 MBL fold metallo-hydrolase [Corallococcus sp. CA031C]RKI10610.1 MBL fold metallo-hydrolase [Corallococcus praedator]
MPQTDSSPRTQSPAVPPGRSARIDDIEPVIQASAEAARPGRTGRRDFLRAAVSLAAGAALLPPGTGHAAKPVDSAALRAQRLAWAGVRLQLGRDTLFLDPLLDPAVWGPALKDPLVPLDVTDGGRFVLVTHRHPDHFDRVAVRKVLGDTGTLVCAPDTAAAAAAAGFRVRSAPLYEPVLLNDFTATAVPAADGYGDAQVSWVVSGGGRRIIHCGDTLWHGSWWHIGRQFGPFDAAFLPINGARFGWRKPVSDVHAVLTPEQAVAAAVVLGARLLVPIHYGVAASEDYQEVPDAEALLLAAARKRKVNVELARPGEWLSWQPRT